jgi:hypothetical protein
LAHFRPGLHGPFVSIREDCHTLYARNHVAREHAATACVVQSIAVVHPRRPAKRPRSARAAAATIEAIRDVDDEVVAQAITLTLDHDAKRLDTRDHITLGTDAMDTIEAQARVITVDDRGVTDADLLTVRLPLVTMLVHMLLRADIEAAARRPAALATLLKERATDVGRRFGYASPSCRWARSGLLQQVDGRAKFLRSVHARFVHALNNDLSGRGASGQ